MVSPIFKNWACSFSGCDGGNIYADVWLCGIEWGGATYGEGDYYEKLKKEIEAGEAKPYYEKKFDWEESLTYPYGRSFAKLFAAIQNEKVEKYKQVAKECTGEELFKLNLYPIAFDDTEEFRWKRHELDKITGFDEKNLFQTWCFFNRFPFFTKVRKERKPKLVICTGITYLRDFLYCFAGDQNNCENIQPEDIKPQSDSNTQNTRRYYWISLDNGKEETDTKLVIIPFFSGAHGLNSDHLIQQIGNDIRDKIIGVPHSE
jgi:hypothetical protein